jgi:tRNA-Thr(GGU) m(6)t(6)A37 methyltransferase TsaA
METYHAVAIGLVDKKEGIALEIHPAYRDALQGLDQYSHLWVLCWFHGNDTPQKRKTLRVHPRGNSANPLTGVFACRSPARPNPVAMNLCRILEVKEDRVVIDTIDAFDQTPILDLKPYIARIDAAAGAVRQPAWLGR